MKKKLQIIILIVFLFIIINKDVYADWSRGPTNINHTSYSQNIHNVRQHDGVARVDDTIFVVTPYHSGGRLEVWRSIDDGDSWVSMGYYYTINSASMIVGSDNQIYIFGRYNNYLNMIKFDKTASSLPSPINIANIGEYNYGGYVTVTATIDGAGRLFITSHEKNSTYSDRDNIVQIISEDNGQTWSSLRTLKLADSDDGWYNGNCAVSINDNVYCTFGSFQENPREIRVTRSIDHGASYQNDILLYSGIMANPHILTKGADEVFVFAQSEDAIFPGRGLVMNHSLDSGLTWSGWSLIDATCNYFDPTAAIDIDDNIYVAGRRDNGTGETGTLCGNSSRMGILKSVDNGQTWTVEQWLNDMERAGTQTKLRYQTWYNGGGILEWTWMNNLADGTTPIFYNNNSDIILKTAEIYEVSIILCADDVSYCSDQLACEEASWNWCNKTCQEEICDIIVIRADVNQDSEINTIDAMLTLRNSLDLDMAETAWQISTTTGDVNCDEASNSTDAMLLLRYSLDLDMSEVEWCEN